MNKILIKELNKMRKLMDLEPIKEFDTTDRTSMSEFMSEETDNVDTLIKMMSKYTPKDYWLVSIGYINNLDMAATANTSKEVEDYGRGLGDDYINSIIDSDEWKSGKMKHPHAERQVKGEKIPATIYIMKTYTCQWLSPEARNKMKADKDAQLMGSFQKYNLPPHEVDPNDRRGADWDPIEGTPFDKHKNTGTKRYVMYRKSKCYADTKPIYFINKGGKIEEISKEKADFFIKLGPRKKSIPKYIAAIEDEQIRQEILGIENMYEFKNLDLQKIPFLNCACVVDGKNVRLTYINKNAGPTGVNPGEFKQFIEREINS